MKYPWHLIGHKRALTALERDIESKNLSHAYLFTGPSEVGKSKVALEFAKILQCEQGIMCGICSACREIGQNIHADTVTLGKLWMEGVQEDIEELGKSTNIDQSHRKKRSAKSNEIDIETVRELSSRMYESAISPHKICIIRDTDRLNEESGNALLKLIEEPPVRAIFILTVSHETRVLPTIRSRCRLIPFGYLADEEIAEIVKKVQPEADVSKIVHFAQGKPTKALLFAKNPEKLREMEKALTRLTDLFGNGSLVEKFTFAEELSSDTLALDRFFEESTLLLRSLLLQSAEKGISPAPFAIPSLRITELLQALKEAKKQIDGNLNKRLVLENLFLRSQ